MSDPPTGSAYAEGYTASTRLGSSRWPPGCLRLCPPADGRRREAAECEHRGQHNPSRGADRDDQAEQDRRRDLLQRHAEPEHGQVDGLLTGHREQVGPAPSAGGLPDSSPPVSAIMASSRMPTAATTGTSGAAMSSRQQIASEAPARTSAREAPAMVSEPRLARTCRTTASTVLTASSGVISAGDTFVCPTIQSGTPMLSRVMCMVSTALIPENDRNGPSFSTLTEKRRRRDLVTPLSNGSR